MTEESTRGLSTEELASLRAVLHHGSQEASTALQGWINKTAIVEIDSVDQLPFEEATLLLGAEDEPVCFCSMKLPVPISGELILAFDDASGLALADLALAQPKGHSSTWGELEVSAAEETTNILGCAYVNALVASATNAPPDLIPDPPAFRRDFAASLLQFALMGQASAYDTVFVAKTSFTIDDLPMQWNLLFVPDASAMPHLRRLQIKP